MKHYIFAALATFALHIHTRTDIFDPSNTAKKFANELEGLALQGLHVCPADDTRKFMNSITQHMPTVVSEHFTFDQTATALKLSFLQPTLAHLGRKNIQITRFNNETQIRIENAELALLFRICQQSYNLHFKKKNSVDNATNSSCKHHDIHITGTLTPPLKNPQGINPEIAGEDLTISLQENPENNPGTTERAV